MKIKSTIILSIIMLSVVFTVIAQSDPKFWEDFEAGNFNQWANTNWAIDTGDGAGGSSNSAECPKQTDCTLDSVAVDTTGVSTVNVSFYFKDHGCDANDAVEWFWNDSSGNWDSMGRISAGELGLADDIWLYHSRQSSSSQYMHAGFAVRFYASPGNNEWYNIDNINISTETLVGDTCDCAGLDTNWELDMSENCVIDANCDIGKGNISFINTGEIHCDAKINTSNMDEPTTDQLLWINDSCDIRITKI